jgi:hypothetical protein
VEGIHRTCSCSTRFNDSASTLRQPELLLLSRVVPTMALGHLSETLPLLSPMGVSSVECWDTMLTTVPRGQCRHLRETVVTGLDSHLHRLVLHRLLAREASKTMCVDELIMYQWSKPRMTPAWYWVRFLSTLYPLQVSTELAAAALVSTIALQPSDTQCSYSSAETFQQWLWSTCQKHYPY